MDLYISSVVLGAVGLGAMALTGVGQHGHAGHGSGAHAGHVHAGHSHAGHSHGGGGAVGHGALTGGLKGGRGGQSLLWAVMSPRFLFSVALGFGVVGELARPVLGGPLQLAAALLGGILFERLLVAPLWNFTMRFASAPAVTLESAVSDEATAVTTFDANGQGIVSVEVDGQILQVLATLRPSDRTLGGRVRAGQRVRIEDVNAAASRCTVSLI